MDKDCYQKMYAILCGAASDAIDLLEQENGSLYAKGVLQQALYAAEELYLSAEEVAQSKEA